MKSVIFFIIISCFYSLIIWFIKPPCIIKEIEWIKWRFFPHVLFHGIKVVWFFYSVFCFLLLSTTFISTYFQGLYCCIFFILPIFSLAMTTSLVASSLSNTLHKHGDFQNARESNRLNRWITLNDLNLIAHTMALCTNLSEKVGMKTVNYL